MTKAVDRELRKDLLLKALERFTDLDQAFDAVLRMERFVLEGAVQGDTEKAAPTTMVAQSSAPETRFSSHPNENAAGAKRRSSPKRRWGEEDDARLQELCDQGYTVKEIAAELERSVASVYGRINQFGLSVRAQPRGRRRGMKIKGSRIVENLEPESGATPQLNSGLERSASNTDDGVALEEVIHFLRTRDYSVISTEDGRFKVDGRHVMTAVELLQRANRVRESIGQTAWTTLHEPPLADKNQSGRDSPKAKRNGYK